MANVAIETDAAENIKPTKDKSFGKIDGVVSTIMALGRISAQEIKKQSVYATRGIRVLTNEVESDQFS